MTPHVLEVVIDFFGDRRAECACGWQGPARTSSRDCAADYEAHVERCKERSS